MNVDGRGSAAGAAAGPTIAEKILVTGASGFIGRHVIRRLGALGAEVHAVSRQPRTDGGDACKWWQVELADASGVQRLVAEVRPAVIVHLASEVLGSRAREHVLPTFRSNLLSTVNLLSAAAEYGCRRIVLTGSMEEPDVDAPRPVLSSPYAAAKWAATGYARMFRALYDLDVVTLRLFMVYGPAQWDVRKLVPHVTLALLRGEVPALSSGQRPVDWIYVDDVVEAFVGTLHADPRVAGEVIDVGSGTLVTVRALVEQLAPMIRPDAMVNFGAVPDRPLEQVRAADLAKASAIGWRPVVPLAEGLRRTVEWYRNWSATVPA